MKGQVPGGDAGGGVVVPCGRLAEDCGDEIQGPRGGDLMGEDLMVAPRTRQWRGEGFSALSSKLKLKSMGPQYIYSQRRLVAVLYKPLYKPTRPSAVGLAPVNCRRLLGRPAIKIVHNAVLDLACTILASLQPCAIHQLLTGRTPACHWTGLDGACSSALEEMYSPRIHSAASRQELTSSIQETRQDA